MSTTVDGFVAIGCEVFDDLVLTFESGMVGTQVYAHGDNSLRLIPGAHPALVRSNSVELRILVACALEFEEVRVAR